MAHRHVPFLTDRVSQARDFQVLASLAQKVPVRRAVAKKGLENVDALVHAILGDARAPLA
jgi:hypothetical protein